MCVFFYLLLLFYFGTDGRTMMCQIEQQQQHICKRMSSAFKTQHRHFAEGMGTRRNKIPRTDPRIVGHYTRTHYTQPKKKTIEGKP